jgi:hypothetical protein
MIVEEDKSVRFDSRVEVFYVPGRDDVTREELLASSLTEDDYSRIREREKRLARQFCKMLGVVDIDEDGLGLESKEEKLHRRRRVQNGHMSVLLEQELQWDNNDPDVYFIAQACERYTRESARLAYHRGLSNAVQVENSRSVTLGNKSCMNSILTLVPCRWMDTAAGSALVSSVGHSRPAPCPLQSSENRPPQPWDQWAKHLSEATPMRTPWYFS